MKLFLMIYLAGQVGGWAGPLPSYGMGECIAQRDEMRARQAETLKTGIDDRTGQKASPSLMQSLRTMEFECEFREAAPTMGERKA